jgi:hypothetical protein
MTSKVYTLEFAGIALRMLRATLISAATDTARYYLKGIHIDGEYITGTNGHRMARFKHGFDIDLNIIIPTFPVPKSATKILLVITGMTITVSTIKTRAESPVILLQCIDGKYPDASSVVPSITKKTAQHTACFDARYLADVQTVLNAFGCRVVQPDNTGSAYTIQFTNAPDLEYIVMPARL